MLNVVVEAGRLTRDPELRYTKDQKPVASFSIAVERDFGGEEKKTDFFDCVAWRGAAEFVSRYFKKGDMVIVAGRLQQREWLDRDQVKRHSIEINAESVYFGQKKAEKLPDMKILEKPAKFTELEDEDGELPF